MRILITGARAPIAADLARALAGSGHKVIVADSVRWPLGATAHGVQACLRLPPPRTHFAAFRTQLATACDEHRIDAIVPTSEEVFWLAAAAPALPRATGLRTSPLATLTELHDKIRFAALATRLGFGVPENLTLCSEADVAGVQVPENYVFKPAFSRFASRTLIAPSRAAVARLTPSTREPWLAQSLVRGREICSYNVAEQGRLLLHVAYEPAIRFGTGASVYFLPVADERVRAMAEKAIAATNFTGQIGFDVIVSSGHAVALECNPRGTSGVHLAVQEPAALAAALLGETPARAVPALPEPRMLLLPLLLQHPGTLLRRRDRQLLAAGRDAMALAGVPRYAQVRALFEIAIAAARSRASLIRISTADFEWNGEPIDA